jgi:hypothetical protein
MGQGKQVGKVGIHTVVGDAPEGLLEQLSPVQVQAVQPRRVAAFLEGLCVLMRILLLHLGEARSAQIRQVLPVCAPAVLLLSCACHGGDICSFRTHTHTHTHSLRFCITHREALRDLERRRRGRGEARRVKSGRSVGRYTVKRSWLQIKHRDA